jgi:hypothetical protein
LHEDSITIPDRDTSLIRAFIDIARAVRHRETALVARIERGG